MRLQGLMVVNGGGAQETKTRSVRKNNTSGVSGVEWVPCKKHWKATICVRRKRYYLGAYSEFEDAVKVRKEAEGELHNQFLLEYAAQVQSAGV